MDLAAEQWDAARKLADKLRIEADSLRAAGGEPFHKAQAAYERAALEEVETFDDHAKLKAILDADTFARFRSLLGNPVMRIQLGGILLETPQIADMRNENVEAVQRLDDQDAEIARLKLLRTAERRAVRV